MSKTVEYLLMPRYKVVSDWPGRKDFVVGEVVTLDKDFSPQYKKYEITDCQGTRSYITSFFEMFPLQFKKLEWWEERDFDLSGMYVRYGDLNDRHACYKLKGKIDYPNMELWFMDCGKNEHQYPIHRSIPITEEEYNQYIASKK